MVSLLDVVKQVLTSWQVIVITVVMAGYLFLVNYASKARRRRAAPLAQKPRALRRPKKEKEVIGDNVDTSDVGL
jgi:hypothetical protein